MINFWRGMICSIFVVSKDIAGVASEIFFSWFFSWNISVKIDTCFFLISVKTIRPGALLQIYIVERCWTSLFVITDNYSFSISLPAWSPTQGLINSSPAHIQFFTSCSINICLSCTHDQCPKIKHLTKIVSLTKFSTSAASSNDKRK